MNSVSTHTASFLGGSTLGAALLTILSGGFHMDPGQASAWVVIASAIFGGPVLAYLAVKAKGDPALAAALNAITAIAAQQQANGHTPGQPEVEATVTATANAPAAATVTATVPPPPSPPTVVPPVVSPPLVTPTGTPITPTPGAPA